ncbi:MAG: MazG nucleotide pyrophosphohydrolase domain-containing protein [Candidatus Nanoarchaeia archaeon]
MKVSFEEFTNKCKKSMELDPFVKERCVAGYAEEMENEIEELKQAIENNDMENVKEELGDVLLDWVHLAVLSHRKYGLEINDIITDADKKLSRRKPYIEENRKVTIEEALKTWQDVKKWEKEIIK